MTYSSIITCLCRWFRLGLYLSEWVYTQQLNRSLTMVPPARIMHILVSLVFVDLAVGWLRLVKPEHSVTSQPQVTMVATQCSWRLSVLINHSGLMLILDVQMMWNQLFCMISYRFHAWAISRLIISPIFKCWLSPINQSSALASHVSDFSFRRVYSPSDAGLRPSQIPT